VCVCVWVGGWVGTCHRGLGEALDPLELALQEFQSIPCPLAPQPSTLPSLPLQLENIGNFIKAITKYGVKPHDIFEANDLFENTNHTQVQSTLLALASMVSVGEEWAWGRGQGWGRAEV
jgi:hypothetical protein